jgi:acyl-CoA synthetase (AMP-forming)/AMP-acid ligase II
MDAMAPSTIPELLDAAVQRDGGKLWLVHEDERYSYGQAAERIATIAAGLADRGAGHGNVVLATAHNTAAYLLCWLATVRLGALYVPVNPASTATELAGLVAQTQPHLIVTDAALSTRRG